MAGFFNKVKNTGIKAKLQGECTLLDRELKARQHKFGIDLYDLLRDQEKSSPSNMLGVKMGDKNAARGMPGSFKYQIKEHWEKVRTDIAALEQTQEGMRVEKTHEEVRRERGLPAVTAKEKAQKAGGYVTSTGREAKLMAQIALKDREIKKRKEQFGLDVYEAAIKVIGANGGDPKSPRNGGGGKEKSTFTQGVQDAMRGALTQVSESEQRIQQCVELAARDVGTIQKCKQTRLREIDALDEDGAISFRNKNRTEV